MLQRFFSHLQSSLSLSMYLLHLITLPMLWSPLWCRHSHSTCHFSLDFKGWHLPLAGNAGLCHPCGQIWKGHSYTFFHAVSGGQWYFVVFFLPSDGVWTTHHFQPPDFPKWSEAKWGALTSQASLISAWLLDCIACQLSLLSHQSRASGFSECLYVVHYFKVLAPDLRLLINAVTRIMDAETHRNNIATAEISCWIFQNNRLSCIAFNWVLDGSVGVAWAEGGFWLRSCLQLQEPEEGAGDLRLALASVPAVIAGLEWPLLVLCFSKRM